jgi:hypothetical protein
VSGDAARSRRASSSSHPQAASISSCESGPGNCLTPGENSSAGHSSSGSHRGQARANRLRIHLVPVGQKADRLEDHRVRQGAEGVDGSTRPPGAGALDQRTTGEAQKRRARRARPPRSDRSDGAPAAARRQRPLTGEVVAKESQELRGTPPGPRAAGAANCRAFAFASAFSAPRPGPPGQSRRRAGSGRRSAPAAAGRRTAAGRRGRSRPPPPSAAPAAGRPGSTAAGRSPRPARRRANRPAPKGTSTVRLGSCGSFMASSPLSFPPP